MYRFHSNVFLLRGFPLLKLHAGGYIPLAIPMSSQWIGYRFS